MHRGPPVFLLLVYGVALLAAVLFSERSNRTVLSSAVLFLATGFVVGPAGFDLIELQPSAALVVAISELALFTILFSDGLKLSGADLREVWRLPGRALLIGMPLTAAFIAIIARWMFGVTWTQGFLVGAILSPTDPVFASAIIGRGAIPVRVRRLLNVESGVNDGLALPVVIALLAVSTRDPFDPWALAGEVAAGLALGCGLAATIAFARKLPLFAVSQGQEGLFPLAIGIVVLATASQLGANIYLAAFGAGVALSSLAPEVREHFREIGDRLGEVLKLAAVLVIGIVMSAMELPFSWLPIGFAVLVLVAARPIALAIALMRARLSRRERLLVQWFGPKGFASVIYGLMLLRSDAPDRELLFRLVATVIVLSIVLHSSSDVPLARYFERIAGSGEEQEA